MCQKNEQQSKPNTDKQTGKENKKDDKQVK